MTTTSITGGLIVHPGSDELATGSLVMDGVQIEAVDSALIGATDRTIDATGLVVAPGLIDLQVNGGWGFDLTVDPSAVFHVGERLSTVGVTSWLPTLVSPSVDKMRAALNTKCTENQDGAPGAHAIGWHFEGPWINPERRGAHPESAMMTPPVGLPEALQATLVTLAPELDNASAFIRSLVSAGVTVSVGHSAATSEAAVAAFDLGASLGTHLFNAMSGLHHREPGVAAALLDDQRPWVGLIADGVHIAPEILRLAWRAASDRILLVSDAMAAAGLGDGVSTLGDQTVTVSNGAARLDDGTLAGSAMTLDAAVRNLVAITGCTPAVALRAAAEVPAKALGLHERGQLAAGARADVVILTEALEVEATFVAGSLVHMSERFAERLDSQWKL